MAGKKEWDIPDNYEKKKKQERKKKRISHIHKYFVNIKTSLSDYLYFLLGVPSLQKMT